MADAIDRTAKRRGASGRDLDARRPLAGGRPRVVPEPRHDETDTFKAATVADTRFGEIDIGKTAFFHLRGAHGAGRGNHPIDKARYPTTATLTSPFLLQASSNKAKASNLSERYPAHFPNTIMFQSRTGRIKPPFFEAQISPPEASRDVRAARFNARFRPLFAEQQRPEPARPGWRGPAIPKAAARKSYRGGLGPA